jgi:hypothetical protein
MKTLVKPLVLGSGLVLMLCADFAPDVRLKVQLIRPAGAIIGLPFTPLSVAGVARRTAYREVAYTSAAVAATSASAAAAASASAAAAAKAAAPPPPPPAPAGGPVPIGTVVQALPPGCVPAPIKGVAYQDCGGNFYRAAFQGNNLVYVVSQP